MAPRLLYVVTEDWYFLSHRLPMARAASAAGYEVHVATRIQRQGSDRKGGLRASCAIVERGCLSPTRSLAGVAELRRLLRALKPDILHNISLKPVLLGGIGEPRPPRTAVVNSLTGLGTLFIGKPRSSKTHAPAGASPRSSHC